jgi:hypothetical protein
MSDRDRFSPFFAAALLCAGLSTGAVLWIGGPLSAQTTDTPSIPPASSPPPGSIALTEVPFYAEWAKSPHAHRSSEAFTHWNKEGTVPVACARCHSTPGFQDYLGADGSATGVVDRPAPIGTVITCVACHNSKTRALTSVVFPSGARVDNLGTDARCMACHQGVESTDSVTKAVANIGEDAVDPKLGFLNVHYRAAGATLMGSVARGAYQYPGKTYAGRFQHREPYSRCGACHDVHTTEVKVVDCAACHRNVTDKPSLHKIRLSMVDYDGNGDVGEGLAQEIENLRVRLYAAIQAYAKTAAGKPIAYDLDAYPYFFVDTNANGVADKDEAKFPNKYNAWTPRLLKAAYNYQFVTKEPGAYAHNPVYTIQILYDSLSDLGPKGGADISKAKRP